VEDRNGRKTQDMTARIYNDIQPSSKVIYFNALNETGSSQCAPIIYYNNKPT